MFEILAAKVSHRYRSGEGCVFHPPQVVGPSDRTPSEICISVSSLHMMNV